MTVIKQYSGGQWLPVIIGSQGPQGPTGPASTTIGPTGSTGPTGPKSIGVAAPVTTDKVILFWATGALSISKLVAVLPGGTATPSVTYSVRHGTDVSAAGTEVVTSGNTVTSVTTGTSVTSFNNPNVSAGSFIWITFGAVSGTVPMFSLTVEF